MSLYTIGEVAELCTISPATLRAWQRRYGLLKPQRSEGGHRQFNEQDVARINTILHWIERGVPVSQIKPLLDDTPSVEHDVNWATLQQQLLALLHIPAPAKLRSRLFEKGREYPPQIFINHILRPLRMQLSGPHEMLLALRTLLDGIIIEYATFCMNSARKKTGKTALLMGWGKTEPIELWMAAIVTAKAGLHLDILPQPLEHPPLNLFKADRYFIATEGPLNTYRRKQLAAWRLAGMDITLIGSTALLVENGGHIDGNV
ncbi:MerR family transcriptional regulator [Serratia sp. UGAL515B_01]|uniref:MerR family transcriptional regulator n=1 Tax=Serratia sp. UGAL515B_01 TaxID=2986763 RepID=UPI002955601C|nr:MerR family transcriptional regulator [Serratia sp. UGAL515B_01]WON78068.1 MerR family transcriptional regulator [Serratia sp. UGAL515B_01]